MSDHGAIEVILINLGLTITLNLVWVIDVLMGALSPFHCSTQVQLIVK